METEKLIILHTDIGNVEFDVIRHRRLIKLQEKGAMLHYIGYAVPLVCVSGSSPNFKSELHLFSRGNKLDKLKLVTKTKFIRKKILKKHILYHKNFPVYALFDGYSDYIKWKLKNK